MALEDAVQLITKDFLEDATGCRVLNHSVENGTRDGDNNMSVLYSISANVVPHPSSTTTTTRYYLLKSYPTHPARQKFLNNANLFFKETSFYTIWLEQLTLFQKAANIPDRDIIHLAVPSCLSGKAINFDECEPEAKDKLYGPLSNYILMVDLRKEFGFQMTDRTKGLDVDHVKLAFNELAIMHALSWAYRNKVEWDLQSKFPFFKKALDSKKLKMWMGVLNENVDTAVSAIDAVMKKEDHILSKSIKSFSCLADKAFESFITQSESSEKKLLELHRDPPEALQCGANAAENEPWRVICHGDCWNNNMLYQYDQLTKKPVKVALVDFPLAKLGCPTLDLACLVYTSTRRAFREMHIDECLQSYHETFNEVCKQMGVKTLPGFCFTSLKSRYHVMKLVRLLIAAISLPLNLLDLGKGVDFEKQNDNVEMQDMLKKACASGTESSLYQTWIVELVQELYDQGVI